MSGDGPMFTGDVYISGDMVMGDKMEAAGGGCTVTPAQLPHDVVNFSGRRDLLSELDAVAAGAPDGAIITVQGMPGVGKTSLVVHWACRVKGRFPDGQLYLNLRGHSARAALSTAEALGQLLRGLGCAAGEVPVDQEERAALYRSLLDGRRVLIVLDDAASAAQVRGLLPGGQTCLVLITSRHRLAGLVVSEGATLLPVGVLSLIEARELLTAMLGADLVAREPDAVDDLARLCGHLPLALRLAAATLVVRPGGGVADLVDELGQRDRLALLMVEDEPERAVRGAFDLSYRQLEPGARRLFRRLGLVEGPDLSADTAAALADRPVEQVRAELRTLAEANLVTAGDTGRYTLHDLLREYARERCEAEEPARAVRTAVRRLLGWYLSEARDRANTPRTALAWFEAERANLVAASRQAARVGAVEVVWQLAEALYGFLDLRRYVDENLELHRRGLAEARRKADRRASAQMLYHLAVIYREVGRYRESLDHAELALHLWRALGDVAGEGAAYNCMARVHLLCGRYTESLNLGMQAFGLRNQIGDRRGEAETLDNIAGVYWRMGRYEDSLAHLDQALEIWREIGDRRGEAEALTNSAVVYDGLGRYQEALAAAELSLPLRDQTGDRYGEGYTLDILAYIQRSLGRYDEALANADASLQIRREIGDRHGEAATLCTIGAVRAMHGAYEEALRNYERSLRIRDEIGDLPGKAFTLDAISEAFWRQGRAGPAFGYAERALEIRREVGDLRGQGDSLVALARVQRRCGAYSEAALLARSAVKLHREIDNRQGQGAALEELARCWRRLGEHGKSLRSGAEAIRIMSEIADLRGQARAFDNRARVRRHLREYDAATADARRALHISRDLGDRHAESRSLQCLASIAYREGELHAARRRATEALEVCEETHNLYGTGMALHLLGVLAESGEDPAEAHRLWERAAHVRQEIEDVHGEAATLERLAALHQRLGRPEQAEMVLRRLSGVRERLRDAG